MYIYMHMSVYIHTYIYIYICVYICICLSIFIYIHIYIFIYIKKIGLGCEIRYPTRQRGTLQAPRPPAWWWVQGLRFSV